MVIDSDRGFLAKVTPPAFLAQGSWSLWEYFTGFLLGFGIMLILICLPESIAGGEGRFEYEPAIENDKLRAAYHTVLTFVAVFVLTLARPLGGRISEWVAIKGWSEEEALIQIIIAAVLCVLAAPFCAVIAKKNCVARGLAIPVKKRAEDFGMLMFVLAPGAFLVLGALVAVMNIVRKKMDEAGKPLAKPSGCLTGDCANCTSKCADEKK